MTPAAPLLEQLSVALPGLRASERKVAELVADDPAFVVGASMAAVAAKASVSEPTVMRFCTSVGFTGFQQFKIALAQALAIGLPATVSTISPSDSIGVLGTKVFDHTISSLDRARRLIDPAQIERAVEAILGASSLTLVGLGASGIIALDAEQKSALFGVPCSAPVDPHQQYIAAAMTRPGAVFVAISNTGRTESILQIASLARQNGATVVGISGDSTPLLAQCDVPVIVRTIDDTDVFTPTVSRLAGLVVVDILATAVSIRRGPDHLARVARMKEGLTAFRQATS